MMLHETSQHGQRASASIQILVEPVGMYLWERVVLQAAAQLHEEPGQQTLVHESQGSVSEDCCS